MRAITIPRFGGPEVLELYEGEDPTPKPGQVAIDVAFAGVNYAEVLYRRGAVDVELPFIPNIEVAGHVRSLGEGVEGLAAGDLVAGLTIVDGGGYAEVAATDARLVRPVAWPEAPTSRSPPSFLQLVGSRPPSPPARERELLTTRRIERRFQAPHG